MSVSGRTFYFQIPLRNCMIQSIQRLATHLQSPFSSSTIELRTGPLLFEFESKPDRVRLSELDRISLNIPCEKKDPSSSSSPLGFTFTAPSMNSPFWCFPSVPRSLRRFRRFRTILIPVDIDALLSSSFFAFAPPPQSPLLNIPFPFSCPTTTPFLSSNGTHNTFWYQCQEVIARRQLLTRCNVWKSTVSG